MMSQYELPLEKLRGWQDARAWVRTVYVDFKSLPAKERFGMTSQLTRAAVSFAANLARGSGRTSLKDQAHFSQLAYGSLMDPLVFSSLREIWNTSMKQLRLTTGVRSLS